MKNNTTKDKSNIPAPDNLWHHQDEAVRAFLARPGGILEMATGTGKTRTALRIVEALFQSGAIGQVILLIYGNDLLEQWYRELLLTLPEAALFRWYGNNKEFSRFQLYTGGKRILLVTREGRRVKECLERLEKRFGTEEFRAHTLLLFDEVHGIGSDGFCALMRGRIAPYRYRLGLSATPVREFDQEGTQFLFEEVGPVVYRFGLEDAVRRGILCEFSYVSLEYTLTQEERKRKQNMIVAYEMGQKEGASYSQEELYRNLARVNKTATDKLSAFGRYLCSHPEILEHCIIFVETRAYGLEVQKILLPHTHLFHTYYGEDEYKNLLRFGRGEIQCLITCKKISEGIDMKSVRNIVLFSSDRGRLVTTQRIGRSLRRDPENPDKRALVVDFVCRRGRGPEEKTTSVEKQGQREELSLDEYERLFFEEQLNADEEREAWLRELAGIRREEHEAV